MVAYRGVDSNVVYVSMDVNNWNIAWAIIKLTHVPRCKF